MSAFKGKAKSLESAFVFYERLPDTYPMLYTYVKSTANRINRQVNKQKKDSSFVSKMAQVEFQKEKNLLEKVFGVSFDFDYYGRGVPEREGIKEVIETFNKVLNLKDAYERNKLLIQNSQGQKALFSWYPTYFMRAFEQYWPKIYADFKRHFGDQDNIGETLGNSIKKYIEQICILGIEKMLKGPEVENSIYGLAPQLKTAYEDLLNNIGTIADENSMAGQIFRIYHLDTIKDDIVKKILPQNQINKKKIMASTSALVKKGIFINGGLTLEAFETAILQNMTSNKGGTVFHSGPHGIKADNILSFNLDPSIINETLEQTANDREKNIKAFSDLGGKLANVKEGFVVYSSDKNYKVDSNFSGFSAGSLGVNAAAFLSHIYHNEHQLWTLIGAIQQLGKRAILEGKEVVYETLLAQDVAYMLFDDYATIGKEDAGGNSIHIMNLNGIMFPLSAILFLLAKGIDALERPEEIRSLVAVDIHAPKIEFEKPEDQTSWMANHPGQNPWEFQRYQTFTNTTISAKFLRDFRKIIIDLL